MTDRTRATLCAVAATNTAGVALAGGALSGGADPFLVGSVAILSIIVSGLAGLVTHSLWSPYV